MNSHELSENQSCYGYFSLNHGHSPAANDHHEQIWKHIWVFWSVAMKGLYLQGLCGVSVRGC